MRTRPAVTNLSGPAFAETLRWSPSALRVYAPPQFPMTTFRGRLLFVMFLLAFGPAAAQQEPTFSAESNVVLVPTLVMDAKGNAVYGLRARDFLIEDNGVEQVSHLDETAEAQPVSVMIAIQCGRRAAREFTRMQGLASMLQPVLSAPNT
jgi:hypothetical protein